MGVTNRAQFNPSTVKVISLYSCYLHRCIFYFDSLAGSEVNMQYTVKWFQVLLVNICPISKMKLDNYNYLEYSDYWPYHNNHNHNISANMFFDLLQVFHVELGSLHEISIWTLYLNHRSKSWRSEGSLFNNYHTVVSGRAQLLSLDCSTLLLIRTLYCLVLRKDVSNTIFKVFGMTRPGTEPFSCVCRLVIDFELNS